MSEPKSLRELQAMLRAEASKLYGPPPGPIFNECAYALRAAGLTEEELA